MSTDSLSFRKSRGAKRILIFCIIWIVHGDQDYFMLAHQQLIERITCTANEIEADFRFVTNRALKIIYKHITAVINVDLLLTI